MSLLPNDDTHLYHPVDIPLEDIVGGAKKTQAYRLSSSQVWQYKDEKPIVFIQNTRTGSILEYNADGDISLCKEDDISYAVTFGTILKAARIAGGYSQAMLGRAIGRTKIVISSWERDAEYPEDRYLKAMANILDCDFSQYIKYIKNI